MKWLSVIFALLALMAISYILYREIRNKSLSVFLWATLLFMFGLTNFRDSVAGNDRFGAEVIGEASLFVTIFCCLYLLGRSCFIRYVFPSSKQKEPAGFYDSFRKQLAAEYLVFALLCICTYFRYERIASLGINFLDSSWGIGREVSASSGYVNSNQLTLPLYFLTSGLILYALILKKKYLLFLTTGICLFNVILTRNKVEVLPLLIGLVYYVLYIKKLTRSKIVLLAFLSVVCIYFIYALQVFRHYGSVLNFWLEYDFIDFNKRILTYISEGKSEIGLYNDFYYFIAHNNNFENFGQGHSYLRVLLFWLPTEWSMGIKPPDFAISMGTALNPATRGLGESAHPTLFGDCYANLNFAGGVLLSFFWAWIVSLVDYCVSVNKNLLYRSLFITLGASFLVVSGRGAVYNSFFLLIMGGILLMSIKLLFRIRLGALGYNKVKYGKIKCYDGLRNTSRSDQDGTVGKRI